MQSFNVDLPGPLQPSPQPVSHCLLCQTGRYRLRAPLCRPRLARNKRKDIFLVKYKIAVSQCQKNCGQGTLGCRKDILDLNPDEVVSPLCDAALQAEE